MKKNEIIWVIIACIIPDLPWIELKLLLATHTINPYDLRLYCTAQASLLFCLILAASLCLWTRNSIKIFLILGINSLFHLLLDSLQIKWGNGVNIISPFNWELFHLDIFWPDFSGTIILSVVGFIYLLYNWNKLKANTPLYRAPGKTKYVISSLFITLYVLGPLYFINQLDDADTYYVHTMRNISERTGKPVKLDRAHYNATTHEVKIYSGEKIKITGKVPQESGRVSFAGFFQDSNTIISKAFQQDSNYRDFASFIGLFMACTLVLQSLVLATINSKKSHSG